MKQNSNNNYKSKNDEEIINLQGWIHNTSLENGLGIENSKNVHGLGIKNIPESPKSSQCKDNYNQNCCMGPGIENLNDYPTKHHSKQHSNEYRIHLYITNKKWSYKDYPRVC